MILKPTALDTIIQSSTVELMRSHNVSVAPRPRGEVVGHLPVSEVAGIIRFEGPKIMGTLTLAVPVVVYDLVMQRRPQNTTHEEWTYELTNQVMGRIRARLIQFQVRLRTYVPVVLSGLALERHRRSIAADVAYRFGTLRGEITISVDASLTRAVLEYSNAPLVISDTDLLLFD